MVLIVGAAPADHPAPAGKATLMGGLSNHHHPVSTKNADAQKFFDQGLRLIFAFNHDEARRSFQRAAELDSGLAMAHWGIALSVGPNYNLDAQAEALKTAYAAIQKALKLSLDAPEPERDYVVALSKRYAKTSRRLTRSRWPSTTRTPWASWRKSIRTISTPLRSTPRA
jgi:hypothetical protein